MRRTYLRRFARPPMWLTVIVAIAAVVACDQGPTRPVPLLPHAPQHIDVIADSDSIIRGACTSVDAGHCNFWSVTQTDMDWLQDAAAFTTCPAMRNWMNAAIVHGYVHKTDESSYKGFAVYGVAHWPAGTSGSIAARVHLDANNAFSSFNELAITFRHEVAHVLFGNQYPSADTTGGYYDSIATSCTYPPL